MYQKTEKIWMDGKFVPWAEAKVHVLTHSLHYGVGIFEGIRYYDTGKTGSAVFRLKEHMRRFEESARIVALTLPFKQNELVQACVETARINGLKEGYLRPLGFIGDEPSAGLWAYNNDVHVTILTWGWGAYLGTQGITQGIRAKTSSFPRLHRVSSMMQGKICGQYVNSVLSKREAKLSGYDEAIMLDPQGFVAEGTGENIFVVRDGVVRTPTLGSVLNGITRDTVITLLKNEGIVVREDPITRDDLYIADEIFLTGTAAEVTPIREMDDRAVNGGKPGPITQRVQKLYDDAIHGKLPAHKDWLTFIER